MASSTDSWGIEVGSNAIKAIRLKRSGQNISVAEFEVVPHKKVLSTPETDTDEAIKMALMQFLAHHKIGGASVVVSVPGNMAFARFAKLPPVEPKKVPAIVQFEAVQQIPFPINEVEWDYQTFQYPDSPDVEVGIFAITKERVTRWLSNFYAVGLPVHGVTLSAVAVYNAISYDLGIGAGGSAPGTVLDDICTNNTDVIVIEAGRIWLRTIPLGGHHFTEALVSAFKLPYSKAEQVKREAATSKHAKEIFQAMRPAFTDLAGEIQRSLGFYQSMNKDADVKQVIGLGSTFKLPGLAKFLEQQLQMPVGRVDSYKKLQVPTKGEAMLAEHAVELAPAYGLALQGLELEAVSANILPADIIRQQIFGKKKFWEIAAAVLVMGAAGIGYGRLANDQQAYHDNAPMNSQIETIAKQGDGELNEWQQIQATADPRPRIDNLRRLLDGRRFWPLVIQDVSDALAATSPQAELLSGDVAKIKAIPRNQRRQVVIDSLQSIYELDPAAVAAAPPPEAPPPAEGADPNAPPPPTAKKQPAFLVTMTGSTTSSDASRFLTDSIIKTLKDKEVEMTRADEAHKKDPKIPRRDHPYRILNVELKEVAPLGAAGAVAAVPGAEAAAAATAANAPLPGVNPNLPGVKGTPTGAVKIDPATGKAVPTGTGVPNYEAYMPTNPFVGEDRSGDWKFTITFRVELLPPEQPRKNPEGGENAGDPNAPAAEGKGQ